jgi:cytosine/adenosine deaminase-related metal-dependent hydrolase
MHERLRTGQRGRFTPEELLGALTRHDVLGERGARIEVGAPADLVAVRTDTVRTAGADPAQIVLAATAADVDTVIVGGTPIVRGGRHRLGDVAALLRTAIEPLWESE